MKIFAVFLMVNFSSHSCLLSDKMATALYSIEKYITNQTEMQSQHFSPTVVEGILNTNKYRQIDHLINFIFILITINFDCLRSGPLFCRYESPH